MSRELKLQYSYVWCALTEGGPLPGIGGATNVPAGSVYTGFQNSKAYLLDNAVGNLRGARGIAFAGRMRGLRSYRLNSAIEVYW